MKVIRFTASWCGPCKSLEKSLSLIETTVPITVVDIDDDPTLASKFAIRSVPTMVMLDEDETIIKRLSGAHPQETLKEWLNG
jgi:thioredoxin-like negative regulator of GroEL